MILSIFSLFFSYLVEYVGHLTPCPLCIYQRFPYLIFIFITIMCLAQQKYSVYNKYVIAMTIVAIILAGYHTAIERGMLELSSFCKPLIQIKDNISVSDFTKLLYNQDVPLCNRPLLVMFGFSMTEWNLFLNLLLFVFFVRINAKTIF